MTGPDTDETAAVEHNQQLRAARERTPSRRTPGACLGRQELAELANEWIYRHCGWITALDGNYLGKLERGRIRWPGEACRAALRAVLGAVNDAQLGFYNARRMSPQTTQAERERFLRIAAQAGPDATQPPTSGESAGAVGVVGPVSTEQPWPSGSGGGGVAGAANRLVAGGVAAPVCPAPGHVSRVMLHWNGRKAWALRNAMRFTVREFAAKLGVSPTVVRDWHNEAAGRLRFESHQMLDTMLSLATDYDVRRFDLALREVGERR